MIANITTHGRGTGAVAMLALLAIAGCGSHNSGRGNAPVTPAADITVSGVVSDGPVVGGRLFGFRAADVASAFSNAATAGERAAMLAAANPVVSLNRAASDGDSFTIDVDPELAGQPLFLVFDNAGATDERFNDTPPNLESVAMIGQPGSSQTINVSLHTTLIARIVRAAFDPANGGAPVDAGAIATRLQSAELDVLEAFGHDDDGSDFFNGDRPTDTADIDALHAASSVLGHEFRSAAMVHGLSLEEILDAIAADVGDGTMDGIVPPEVAGELAAAAGKMREFLAHGYVPGLEANARGPCSTSTVVLRRACAVDVVDDRFEGRAICANLADDDARAECLAELEAELQESTAECNDVFQARLAVCDALNDAAHEPAFGQDFAARFVDPREIGASVEPNPYLPLVPGTTWVYHGEYYDEDEDEIITEDVTVTVLDNIKLIDGIPCIVVNDVVTASNGSMEDTDDWIAQDVDGNVWYCGEISRDFEQFEGDVPVEFELVATEGSWKHGRDGAEAGILLPAMPEVGETFRQEALFGEAEDIISIESVTGTETAPGGACDGDCLVTRDFTPLDPGVAENKYYAPGIGMIVEIDIETGDRLELIEFTQP